ncbi:hypothetical protein ACFX19_020492 [Malus domestica]
MDLSIISAALRHQLTIEATEIEIRGRERCWVLHFVRQLSSPSISVDSAEVLSLKKPYVSQPTYLTFTSFFLSAWYLTMAPSPRDL